MRYSLLSYIRCAVCRDGLACFVSREVSTSISPFVAETAARAPAAGHPFAPSPAFVARTPLAARLAALAGPAAPGRNREAAVQSGVLICGGCARWFPILDALPELLPDHLRDATREAALLRLRPIMMTALVACLGLLPAALSTGIGSDTQKPFAIVVVAGLISRLFLGFFVNPVLYEMVAKEGDVLQV